MSGVQLTALDLARTRFENAVAEMHAATVALQFAAALETARPNGERPRAFVKVAVAAKQLGVSRQTVYRMGNAGKLRLVRHMGKMCVPAESLDKLVG